MAMACKMLANLESQMLMCSSIAIQMEMVIQVTALCWRRKRLMAAVRMISPTAPQGITLSMSTTAAYWQAIRLLQQMIL